jgi:hypothetical protein
MPSNIGQALMSIGQQLPVTLRTRQQDAEERRRQEEKDRQAMAAFALAQREAQAKLGDEDLARTQKAGAMSALQGELSNRGTANKLAQIDTSMLGKIGEQPLRSEPYPMPDGESSEEYANQGASEPVDIPESRSADMANERTAGQQYKGMLGRLGGYRLGPNQPVDLALDDARSLAEGEQSEADKVAARAQSRELAEQAAEDRKQRSAESDDLRRFLAGQSLAGRQLTLDTNTEKWTEDQWQKLERRANALNAGSRSALGQSGVANVRAARAMDVLVNKDIVSDPYAYDLVNTDVQGIMKGGAPTNEQLKERYVNLQTQLASKWQQITSNPTAVNQPEVKRQLLAIVNSLREIDNDVIDKNLGVAKVAFKKILSEDPDRAAEFFEAIEQSKDVFPSSGGAPSTPAQKPGAAASGATPTISTKAEYDALPSGTMYISKTTGKRATKP